MQRGQSSSEPALSVNVSRWAHHFKHHSHHVQQLGDIRHHATNRPHHRHRCFRRWGARSSAPGATDAFSPTTGPFTSSYNPSHRSLVRAKPAMIYLTIAAATACIIEGSRRFLAEKDAAIMRAQARGGCNNYSWKKSRKPSPDHYDLDQESKRLNEFVDPFAPPVSLPRIQTFRPAVQHLTYGSLLSLITTPNPLPNLNV
ncbi:hypothetical protein DL93DRAFT_2071360 [Clavulina sp. PMI_390]|nr:hypothetical protein DL93DRAFT_2071360 [Clavulina sp. PMI_390]